jgi:hypothetical protein
MGFYREQMKTEKAKRQTCNKCAELLLQNRALIRQINTFFIKGTLINNSIMALEKRIIKLEKAKNG